jgi:hypothetical protein
MAKRNIWTIYLNPFDDEGQYSGWVDITSDVILDSLGTVSQGLDNTQFDIGIFKNSAFNLVLKNDSGRYSDVDNVKSIFHTARAGSQVKITWQWDVPLAGTAVAGDTWLCEEEIEIFKGIINDDGTSQDVDSNQIKFNVQGRESLFSSEVVPISSIANGDLLSEVIYACLNQVGITNLLTVDQANIVCGNDLAIDDKASLEGKTVLEAVKDLLLVSNSILFIDGDTVYVSARTPSTDVEGNFYGQGSSLGPENIQNLKSINSGLAKVFNYLVWQSTTTIIQDGTSVNTYGARKKSIGFDPINDTTKRQSVLQAIVDEFKNPKQEFDLYTPITFQNASLKLLDKCSIDYPIVYVPNENPVAICGVAVCGEWWTPKAQWDFKIDPLDYYKIINRSVDMKNSILKFRMRLV